MHKALAGSLSLPLCWALASSPVLSARADVAPAAAASPASNATPAIAPASAPSAAPAAASPIPIWQGASGGFDISWSTDGIKASASKGARVFSAKEIADVDFQDFDNCDATEAWTVLSVVGPLVSVKQEENATCAQAAHTSAYTDILTIDLNQPKKAPSLADYFSEAELYAALMGDGIVKKTLAAAGKPTPETSAGLLALLADNSSECDYRFEPATLTHFAFHHVEKGKVAVRVGLPYNCEAARGKLTQLGLLLPIPASLKDALTAAAAQKQGFLAKDEKTVAKDRTAQFHVSATPAAP